MLLETALPALENCLRGIMFAVLAETVRGVERLHERVIAGRAQPRELLNLATCIVPVREQLYDRRAIDLDPINMAPRIAVPKRSTEQGDIFGCSLDRLSEPPDRVGKKNHVLVDLDIEFRGATHMHLLECSR